MDISKLLLNWYKREGRELPWRATRDPYKIWVSEIILQQTRIQQGLEYYYSFIMQFPDVFSLASAEIRDVLKIWQGLGYYSRARNMHEAAKSIVRDHNGKFPGNYSDIIKLKGVGEYTAGAIASIAFGEAVPAIDGNVKRVISRFCGIYDDMAKPSGLKKVREALENLMNHEEPGTFNQALMDLGSLICKPSKPLCRDCPLAEKCKAYNQDIVNELPVKYKKTKNRDRYFYYIIISSGDMVLINQRKKKDIWELLYEFPLIEKEKAMEENRIFDSIRKQFFPEHKKLRIKKISSEITHVLSHQKIHARFIHIETEDFSGPGLSGFTTINSNRINDFPLPRLIDRYLGKAGQG